MSSPPVLTAEDLLEIHEVGYRHELVRGELRRMSAAAPLHGLVAARVTRYLANWVEDRGLGAVLTNDTGFMLERNPDTVLAPDVAFVRRDRLPVEFAPGFFPGPPDLAVETSPCDSWGEVQEMALSWLEHGTRLVWIVDGKAKRVTVYRGPRDVVVLGPADTLDGGEVVPGFAVAVAALFPGPVR
ncbi:MAG TPA: Uma2 family endonuclease [Planctomycetota bacterium]|nr:Uma2 family endonuclease [Planctomycetota bacterium]